MNIRNLEQRFDLERYLEKYKPKKSGDERYVFCPICEKKDKLWVNVVKRISLCYYCDQGYGVLDLIMVLENCNLVRAMEVLVDGSRLDKTSKSLVETVGGLFESGVVEEEDEGTAPEIELPDEFILYKDRFPKVPKYFRERGIKQSRAEKYGLGWCEKGFFFNRLIIPITYQGKNYGFHPRWMKKEPPDADDIKKVAYPKGMKSNLLLFNWDVARKQKRLILCEDPFSAMAVGDQASASFGTKLSSRQLRMILQSHASEITMLWDRDALDKAHKVAEKLKALGFSTNVAELSDERDPDELPRSGLRRLLEQVKPTGLAASLRARFLTGRRRRPKPRLRAYSRLARSA